MAEAILNVNMNAMGADVMPNTLTTHALEDSYSSINELDDIDGAIEWLMKGRANCRGFTKYLPYTAKDLRGKVTPEKVAHDLATVYSRRKFEFEGIGGMGIDHIDLQRISGSAARSALPLKLFRFFAGDDERRNKIWLSFAKDIQMNFVEESTAAKARHGNVETLLVLKQSVDTTCDAWADKLDKELFRGKKEMFLKKCPVYKVGVRRYCEPKMPWYYYSNYGDKPISRRDEILIVAKRIAGGRNYSKHTCWMCNQCCNTGLLKCSKCKVAGYCSRKCQDVAWKEGHKMKCEALFNRYNAFQTNLKVVEKMHSHGNGSVEDFGINHSANIDYFTLQHISELFIVSTKSDIPFEDQVPMTVPPNESDVLNFSMQSYYDNLGRVERGEWWFFDEANMEEYRAAKLPRGNTIDVFGNDTETAYMSQLAKLLCVDNTHEFRVEEWIKGEAMRSKSEFGVAMPASIFIELYQRDVGTTSADNFRLRKEAINRTMHFLSERFHKGPGLQIPESYWHLLRNDLETTL